MKRISFCSCLKALSTDTSFIKIGVCQQKLLALELNFHYWFSSHYLINHILEVIEHHTKSKPRLKRVS